MNQPKYKILAALAIAVIAASAANAQTILNHRYSFSGNANDSVGTANGTLRSAATIDADLLNTTAASGNTTGGVLLPLAATAGITGSFSIETYVINTGPLARYTALYFFGTTDDNHFTQVNADANGFRSRLNPPTDNENGTESFLFPTGTTANQVVSVFDATALTLSLYFNGALLGAGAIPGGAAFNLSSYQGAIAGTPPAAFNDGSFNGSTDDFRIYNGALTANQVIQLNSLGADASNTAIQAVLAPVPEPSTVALLGLGALAVTVAARRRRVA